MARAKQSQKGKKEAMNVVDLGLALGLTRIQDSDWATVSDRMPTFLPQYDAIIGGGIPFGRLTEVYGEKSSGKSTFAVHLTRVANSLGVFVVWIDVEGTADKERMAQLGVDNKESFLIQNKDGSPMTVESVGAHLESLIPNLKELSPSSPILIIWDSVAATPAQKELAKEFGDEQPGIKAKSLTQAINKVAPLITSSKTALIAINQVRDNMGATKYQEQVSSPGGRAFEHWATLSLLFRKSSKITRNSTDKESFGHVMRMTTKKSKVSRPNQEASACLLSEFPLDNGESLYGFDYEYNIYDSATENKLITGNTWKTYVTLSGEEIKKQGKDWVPFLKSPEGAEVMTELVYKLMLIYFPKGYSPLKNETIDISKWRGMGKVLEKYESYLKTMDVPKKEADNSLSDK